MRQRSSIELKHPFRRNVVCCVLCLFSSLLFVQSHAEGIANPRLPEDSVPSLSKTRITVTDLEDGTPVDSANVICGLRSAYTNSSGIVEFDSVAPNVKVSVTRNGYYGISRSASSDMRVRLIRTPVNIVTTRHNGIFSRSQEDYTGAATVIRGEDLRKLSPVSFVDALPFFDPSVQVTRDNLHGDDPNTATRLQIRGRTNFAAAESRFSASPSGVQVNPSSADFIASNVNEPNQPLVLLNGAQVSLQTVLDLDINNIDRVTILKDAAATAMYGVRAANGIMLVQTKQPAKGDLRIRYSGQVQVVKADLSSYNLMNAQQKLAAEQASGYYDASPGLYEMRAYQTNKGVNTNWLQIPLQSAVGMKHTLDLETGNEEITYGLHVSYNDNQGVMKGSGRKMLNLGAVASGRLGGLFFSNRLEYQQAKATNSPYGRFDEYALLNPYWNPYDSITGKLQKSLEASIYNPAYNGTLTTTDNLLYNRIANNTSFEWIIRGGLRLNGRVSIAKQSDEQNYFLPPGHTMFAAYSPEQFLKRGLYDKIQNSFLYTEGQLTLNYNKRIGLHQLFTSVGAGALQTKSESTGFSVVGFASDRMSDLSFGNAYDKTRPVTGQIVTRLASSFGNLLYSYDNRYQLDLTGSLDASSQLGSEQNNVANWSFGAGWNLHQERFFHANSILGQFRLRASTGTAGNLNFQSYLGRTAFGYFSNRQYITGNSNPTTRGIGLGAFLVSAGNPYLTAPLSRTDNAGFDAVLFSERLFVRFDAYRQRTSGIILPVTSPGSTGFLTYAWHDNQAAIENRGVEFGVNYRIYQHKAKGIFWQVMVNGIHNRDRIVTTGDWLKTSYVPGVSPTAIYAVRSLGIDPATGQEKFMKADGSETYTWDAADRIIAGDLQPDWMGSLGTSFTLRNLSAAVYFNYQLGAQAYNHTLAGKVENADLDYNIDKRYQAHARLSPVNATTRLVDQNDFINCSVVSLGYALPAAVCRKVKAQQVNLRLMGEDLFMAGGMAAERGIYYPFQRRYSFSINTSF